MTETTQQERAYVLKVTADTYGNQRLEMGGNMSLMEVLFGLEMAKDAVMKKAQGLGLSKPPTRIELNPKRF